MDIIVETGAIVPNANSYVTIKEAQEYAVARGLKVFKDDKHTSECLIRAMDYLAAFRYKGLQTSLTQSLSWPRTGVYVKGYLPAYDENSIPNEFRLAQIEIAIAIADGVVVFANSGKTVEGDTGSVKKEKVGPIETEYFSPRLPTIEKLDLPYVDKLLRDYLDVTPRLTTVRV